MKMTDWVRACQPPLVRRVRARLIDEWARRVGDADGAGTERLLAMAREAVVQDRGHAAAVRALLERLEAAWDDGDPARCRALIDHLIDEVGDDRARRARPALRRQLDLAAVREHALRLEAHAIRLMLIGLAALGRGAARWIADGGGDAAAVGEVTAALIGALQQPAPWFVHAEVLSGLTQIEIAARHQDAIAFWPAQLGAILMAIGRDPLHAPAVRVQALTLAVREPGAPGLDRAFAVLETWPGDRFAFVIRRAALEAAFEARRSTEAVALLSEWARADDPSEHVRLGVAAMCAARKHPELFAIIERLAGLGEPREASPRVRAVAAQGLVRLHLLGAPTVDRIVLFYQREEAELPLIAISDALREVAIDFVEAIPKLLPALVERLGDARLTGATHEAIAAAAEGLDRVLSGRTSTFEARLAEALQTLRPGGQVRVRVDPGMADVDLGRVLAAASRRDLGLSAQRRRGSVIVRRGDRRARRVWRLIHEARRPAPTKRVGQLHTTGRVPSGRLRAPPGLMDEVTPTEVPGERVHVRREGGWGRALPLLDDLLNLPLLRRPQIQLFSSFGTTAVRAPRNPLRRLWVRARLNWRYARFAEMRLSAHRASEPHRRGEFVRRMRALGFEIDFEPYLAGGAPLLLRSAMPARPTPDADADADADAGATLAAGGAFGVDPEIYDALIREGRDFALSWSAGDQPMLALFLGAMTTLVLVSAALRFRGARRARARIPFTVGGWGTRGKSGTERLKAALFHGLGYDVFVKTTGCEAMLMHSVAGQRQEEILLYRPYDRASIWEHAAMLRLAADLHAEVFLWECMALRERYVDVLQHDWMRDDFATLTNTYPDHEDVQGPAGRDVAQTLANFVPYGRELVTAELNFLPLVRATARARRTRMRTVAPLAGELYGEDLLALFPYAEHPRNIALTVMLAEALGIDETVALLTMAQHVVPDLGVLRIFPPVRLRGRRLTFVNGMSANERAGFLNNWSRAGLDDVPAEAGHRAVLTVVNNRADRIPRSQVFARLLVEEVAADGHVLIGSNLGGLLEFIAEALDRHLAGRQVIFPGDAPAVAVRRLHEELAQVRVPPPRAETLTERLAIWLRGLDRGAAQMDPAPLMALAQEWLDKDGPAADPARIRDQIEHDGRLDALVAEIVAAAPEARWGGPAEALAPATTAALQTAARALLARLIIARRAERAVQAAVSADPEAGNAAYRVALRGLFMDSLVVIEDPNAKGDAIIETCAQMVPPGVEAHVMGIQNIKGTGLDFIYRLQALQTVHDMLAGLAGPPAERLDALTALAAQTNPGLLAANAAVAGLADPGPLTEVERVAHQRALTHMRAAHAAAREALQKTKRPVRGVTVIGRWAWGLVDWIDAIARARRGRRTLADLSAGRISHQAAADAMQALYDRQKRSPWG